MHAGARLYLSCNILCFLFVRDSWLSTWFPTALKQTCAVGLSVARLEHNPRKDTLDTAIFSSGINHMKIAHLTPWREDRQPFNRRPFCTSHCSFANPPPRLPHPPPIASFLDRLSSQPYQHRGLLPLYLVSHIILYPPAFLSPHVPFSFYPTISGIFRRRNRNGLTQSYPISGTITGPTFLRYPIDFFFFEGGLRFGHLELRCSVFPLYVPFVATS